MHSGNRILFTISFLIIISSQLQSVALSQSIPFETIDQGDISYFNYGDTTFLGSDITIKDRNSWEWFWVKHTQGIYPPPPIPGVDFQKAMVLAVFLGVQTSGGGPSIQISSIEEIPNIDLGNDATTPREPSDGISVIVKENKEPGLLTVITNPYHIVKIIRRGHPSVIFQHEPTDTPCGENAQCGENEFCEKAIGSCGSTGTCKARPSACGEIYAPVCGCDQKTYGNPCSAASAGVSILHQGPCEEVTACTENKDCPLNEFCLFPVGACVGPGTCTAKPLICPTSCVLGGICGCDGISYCNACEAYANGVSILKNAGCSLEQGCVNSGGAMTTALCCQGVSDFPNTCAVGSCGCALEYSHQVLACDCGPGKCFDGTVCVPSF